MKIVAIHQPNFYPWLGYFDKIIRSDVFVILDDVQLPKTGGTWSNRVKFLEDGVPNWVTAPIDRAYQGKRLINESFFDNSKDWRAAFKAKIKSLYSRSPFFDEIYEILETTIDFDNDNIARHTTNAILTFSEALGLDTNKFVLSSKLSHSGQSNEMLVSLVQLLNGSCYLCGGGSQGYLNVDVFEKHNIEIKFQNFIHPEYRQTGTDDFISGLSIIDTLMNLGWKETRNLLEIGKK